MEILIGLIVFFIFYYLMRVRGKTKNQIEFEGNSLDKIVMNSGNFMDSNITKIKKVAEKSVSKSYLTNCSWILVNGAQPNLNIIYTFRNNDELLLTTNGIVQRYLFELIIDNNSILITKNNIIEHYNIVNVEGDFLFLNWLGGNEILVFANQTKFKDHVKSELRQLAKVYYNFEKVASYEN